MPTLRTALSSATSFLYVSSPLKGITRSRSPNSEMRPLSAKKSVINLSPNRIQKNWNRNYYEFKKSRQIITILPVFVIIDGQKGYPSYFDHTTLPIQNVDIFTRFFASLDNRL